MRADSSIQFNLPPQPIPPQLPEWLRSFFRWLGDTLKPVGRALHWIAGFFPDAAYAQILLWFIIAICSATLLFAIYNRLRHGKWRLRLPRRAQPAPIAPEDEWTPDETGAHSWLGEADALARQGRFAEAAHHLLFRSIEDIASRRPALVRPALTSREIATSEGIPDRARDLFADISRLVERSLFGGAAVEELDWLKAREAYSDFALPAAWKA